MWSPPIDRRWLDESSVSSAAASICEIASAMSNGLQATSPASATCWAANGWTSRGAWYARRRRLALRTACGPNRAPGR